jgi:hypothetical protein
VRHLLEGHVHRADVELARGLVLGEVERVLDQVVVAPAADHAAERLLGARGRVQLGPGRVVRAGPAVHGHRLLARRVRERVRVRDQVEEVVGVQVRDDDGVHVDVVDPLAQLAEHAVAAVEQHRRLPLLKQIPRTGAPGVLPGGRLAQDRQSHIATLSGLGRRAESVGAYAFGCGNA